MARAAFAGLIHSPASLRSRAAQDEQRGYQEHHQNQGTDPVQETPGYVGAGAAPGNRCRQEGADGIPQDQQHGGGDPEHDHRGQHGDRVQPSPEKSPVNPGLSGHVHSHLQRGHGLYRAPQRHRRADVSRGHAGLLTERVSEGLIEEVRYLGGQDHPGAVDDASHLWR